MPDPIIAASDLRVSFGEREILHGLTFEVRQNETMVVIGGSGSGKSTLLRTLVGLEQPSSGHVHIKGTDITTAPTRVMDEIRKKIGLAFQGGALIGSLTVGENIALPLLEHTTLAPNTIEVMVRIKLEQVGLSGFEHYQPSELSGGMKKRAAFARAMALDPEILFFDEPSAGLDPITAAGIDDLILSLKKAYAISMVVVTHEPPYSPTNSAAYRVRRLRQVSSRRDVLRLERLIPAPVRLLRCTGEDEATPAAWSLGVEEQFYVFLPLFLIVVRRVFAKRQVLMVGVVALLSFAVSVIGTFGATTRLSIWHLRGHGNSSSELCSR